MSLLLRGAFVLGHIGILFLFVLGLGARVVPPHEIWWLQLLGILLPALAAVLVISTAVVLLANRRILFGAGLVALLVFAFRYADVGTGENGRTDVNDGTGLTASLAAVGGSAPDVSRALSVVSFNASAGVFNPPGGDRGLPDVVLREPDVLCLQAFPVGYGGNRARAYGRAGALLDSLGYEIVAPRPPAGSRPPSPIATRLELQQSSVIALTNPDETLTSAPAHFESRTHEHPPENPVGVAVRAQLVWEGRPFAVYNVHLQGYPPDRPWYGDALRDPKAWIRFAWNTSEAFLGRASEARALRRLLDREELPAIVCGDFNTTPHEWVYRHVASTARGTYRSAGGLWGRTYPAHLPLVRIDYVLASPEWRILEGEVGPRLSAAHRPVFAWLAPGEVGTGSGQ